MISSIGRYFVVVALIACMFSCKEGEAYYEFESIPLNEWSKKDAICFEIDSSSINPNRNYALSVEIVHNLTYSYKNLFLTVEHTTQDKITSRDTIECILVDDLGKWLGSGNGATRQLSVLYKSNLKIDTTLHNEINIRHAMQDLKLKGIEKIGLKVY